NRQSSNGNPGNPCGDDVIAFFYVGDFLPHLCNDAAALMAEAHRPREPGAAQLVHLGIANTAGEVTDRDLIWTGIRDVEFLDHQRPSRLYLYGGLALHDRLLRSIRPGGGAAPSRAGPRSLARAAAARSVPAPPRARQSHGPCGSPPRSSTPHAV